METAIIITVNLQGTIGRMVKHETTQVHSVDVSTKEGHSLVISKEILHTDREELKCVRKINISKDAVDSWMKNDDCPEWFQPKRWKVLSKNQKLTAYVRRFDEGYGVSYEIVSLS